ncbi:MAG TPA: hypothetical protein VMI06_12170 [Terriglobia bacterium]|nr:hypothetical protein [Terriglobia bacterium]
MKALTVVFSFVFLAVPGAALGQTRDYKAGAQTSSQRIIVSWTHFGQEPVPPNPVDPPAQKIAPEPAVPPPTNAAENSSDRFVISEGTQDSQASGVQYCGRGSEISSCSQVQSAQAFSEDSIPNVYEADISKKHPHPSEPVDLPVADQDIAPLLNVLSSVPGPQSQLLPVEAAATDRPEVPRQKAQDNSPEAQIAELSAGFKKREAERKAQRAQLLAAGANEPGTQTVAQIEEIRLLLDGEDDRRTTSQRLAKALAALGGELDARANAVQGLIESRKHAAVTAEADLNQLNSLVPQRELALRNLAMLPPSDQSDRIIRGLNAELAQEEDSRKLDEETSKESRGEIKALESEAGELKQAAVEARRRSTSFANAAQAAQVSEKLLADRLEYSVATMRGADLLTSASKALDHSATLSGNAQLGPLPVIGPVPTVAPSANRTTDQLRDCIRKTGNPDACRAQESQ